MPIGTSVNVGGSWEDVTLAYVNVSGTWRRCPELYTRVSGTWELTHSDLSGSVDDTTPTAPIGATSTNVSTASGSNGSGSYTYLWEYVSGDVEPTHSTPTSQFGGWTAPDSGPYTATWQVTITDTYGQSVAIGVLVRFLGD